MQFRSVLMLALLSACAYGYFAPCGLAQESQAQASTPNIGKSSKSITLSVELPGDVELRYKAISFTDGMTVFDALNIAAKHSRALQFKHSGSGEFAFLTEIEGVKNEGASGKNWTYKVDGQRAKVGMGSMKLKEGSHVLWTFGN